MEEFNRRVPPPPPPRPNIPRPPVESYIQPKQQEQSPVQGQEETLEGKEEKKTKARKAFNPKVRLSLLIAGSIICLAGAIVLLCLLII